MINIRPIADAPVAPIVREPEDVVMDIDQVRAWLNAHGFKYTPRQMKRIVTDRKLPFKRGLTGTKLWIWKSQLENAMLPK